MTTAGRYDGQDRGDAGAYDRYLRGMDASMKQKVALSAAHLLAEGVVADMGMGSGTGTHALASLYPALRVVGTDVSPKMVVLARDRYHRDNLFYTCGDIAHHCFRPRSFDGIFDSSVLHHVTSFNGYDKDAAERCLAVQVSELKEHGVLVVRDFVDPGPGDVLLDLPEADGEPGDDPRTCTSAALFERFSREFRRLHPNPGFGLQQTTAGPPLRDGFRRFQVTRTLAAEFVLRKDYRTDWEAEVLEEYTYFDQQRFEDVFSRLGLRILAATPIRNPWIVRHRFEGRFEMRDLDGRALEPPATNFLIAGEKVPAGEGVRFLEADAARPAFLALEHYRDRRSGRVRDLVRRPHLTLDIVPWFRLGADVYVVARRSYPRPILRSRPRGTRSLDGSRPADYVTEPLNVLQRDKPVGRTVEEALSESAGIDAGRIRGMRDGSAYYPSPGGLEEEVRSLFVEIEPAFVEHRVPNVSGFSTSGQVRAIEARQLLRAAQVGGLPDTRLEINVYALLRWLGLDPGAWIGAELELAGAAVGFEALDLRQALARAPRRAFERAAEPAGFLALEASVFEERAADGAVIGSRVLEFVVPRTLSCNTVAVAVLRGRGAEVSIGLDDDDLPAAQSFTGSSALFVAPAWRLPFEVNALGAAHDWVRERLAREYGLRCGGTWELGGRYHPSPGVTPEVVYPIAVEVESETGGGKPLRWVRLDEAAAHAAALQDGHLRTLVLRAAHALGRLAAPASNSAELAARLC